MRGIMTSPQRNDVATSGHPPVSAGSDVFEVFEDGVPPRFRFGAEARQALAARSATVETERPDRRIISATPAW